MRTPRLHFLDAEEDSTLLKSHEDGSSHKSNGVWTMRAVISISVATATALLCVYFSIVLNMSGMRAQAASHLDAEDAISLADNTCEYDLDDLNDFDQGVDHMINAGWRFSGAGGHWDKDTEYRPSVTNLLPKVVLPSQKAFWGYDYPGDGYMKLSLKHKGRLTITAGNAWQRGITAVSLELAAGGVKKILEVPPHTLMQNGTSDFEPGDTLVIADIDQAIIVIDHISLECFPTPMPTAPPTPAPTWQAMPPLIEGSVEKIAGRKWQISTNFAGCAAKCLYESNPNRTVSWWPVHEAFHQREDCASTCALMPYSHYGTTCHGFIYPTSAEASPRCYSVLDSSSQLCSKKLYDEKSPSLCDENLNLYDFAYHHLLPRTPSR